MGAEAAITAYGIHLSPVTSFTYLGRILSVVDNDWSEVVGNLQKARQERMWLTRVLISQGSDA